MTELQLRDVVINVVTRRESSYRCGSYQKSYREVAVEVLRENQLPIALAALIEIALNADVVETLGWAYNGK